VAQMLTCMDDLSAPPAGTPDAQAGGGEAAQEAAGQEGSDHVREGRPHVVVIGATNRPDALDPALRRAGQPVT
jgi:ribosome biogenesis ATPase